jgi:hypothetical protein
MSGVQQIPRNMKTREQIIDDDCDPNNDRNTQLTNQQIEFNEDEYKYKKKSCCTTQRVYGNYSNSLNPTYKLTPQQQGAKNFCSTLNKAKSAYDNRKTWAVNQYKQGGKKSKKSRKSRKSRKTRRR